MRSQKNILFKGEYKIHLCYIVTTILLSLLRSLLMKANRRVENPI